MALAINVAKYLLSLTDTEKGQVVSNLALQKLLYYCQGYYLAYTKNKEALFEEDIIAWRYGPVIPSVYNVYKRFGSRSLPVPTEKEVEEVKNSLIQKQMNVIEAVNDVYKIYSAVALMEKTHQESPWRDTEQSEIISRDKIYNFFKDRVIR